jgi:MFS family permease
MEVEIQKHLRHNLTVNLLDGAFFGLGLGFASFTTIIPLFVATMTDSALLIGLIPAIHNAGWQLPQLFTANWVSRQPRIKPLVLSATIQERLPFLLLAGVAGLIPSIGTPAALALTFLMLIWQGLGAGLTANPWQSMIAKIIPSDRRSTFIGVQAAAANLLASVSAAIAGMILFRLDSPGDFALNFLFCSAAMTISWIFLSGTREPAHNPLPAGQKGAQTKLWPNLGRILRQDSRFRWFLAARIVSQFATMGAAFYSVFAVQNLGASEAEVGWMTSTLLGTAIVANVAMGWVGDRWSRKGVMEIGLGAAALGALLAWWAPSAAWFYLVFALTSVGNVAIWTIGISMSMDFGAEAERPTYIGMSNTLIAPANILAPFLGGWLAQIGGYPAAFLASAVGGILAIAVFHWQLKDERETGLRPEDLHSTGQKEA